MGNRLMHMQLRLLGEQFYGSGPGASECSKGTNREPRHIGAFCSTIISWGSWQHIDIMLILL